MKVFIKLISNPSGFPQPPRCVCMEEGVTLRQVFYIYCYKYFIINRIYCYIFHLIVAAKPEYFKQIKFNLKKYLLSGKNSKNLTLQVKYKLHFQDSYLSNICNYFLQKNILSSNNYQ